MSWEQEQHRQLPWCQADGKLTKFPVRGTWAMPGLQQEWSQIDVTLPLMNCLDTDPLKAHQ